MYQDRLRDHDESTLAARCQVGALEYQRAGVSLVNAAECLVAANGGLGAAQDR
jgi:hypothetical protein